MGLNALLPCDAAAMRRRRWGRAAAVQTEKSTYDPSNPRLALFTAGLNGESASISAAPRARKDRNGVPPELHGRRWREAEAVVEEKVRWRMG